MKKLKNLLIVTSVIGLITITAYGSYRLAFRKLIFPKVSVAGINVGGLDKNTALKVVANEFANKPTEIILVVDKTTEVKLEDLKIEHDLDWAVDQAIRVGRNGNILTQLSEQIRNLTEGRSVEVPIKYDQDELANITEETVNRLSHKPIMPKLIREQGIVKFVPGLDGMEIKTDTLTQEIIRNMALPGDRRVELPLVMVSTKESLELVKQAQTSLAKWGDRALRIKFRDYEKSLSEEQMLSIWGLITETIDNESYKKLVEELQPSVETEPRDAVFVFENNKVNEFKPEVVGAKIDLNKFKEKLAEFLIKAEDVPLDIPMILSYPAIKAGDINNLGIKELIGTGKSTFHHSIPGRVFNVNLAASRVNGAVVAPGQEFSFNKTVGEISRLTGYQTAYVISGGKTVLGDGGGVCQVSTTLFRAALNTGLPITERKAHAYRVGYYEQDGGPGIDATVFSPSVDFKFLNDTGHHILIQTMVDTKNLTMKVDIYGTSDGRKATITQPKISSQTPAPATVYTDDPTLPKGVLKQIDWSAPGAKVSFDYKVERNGQVITEKTFFSNYQPWRAVYLRGTRE